MSFLLEIDHLIFDFINQKTANPFFDVFGRLLSSNLTYIFVFVIFLFWTWKNQSRDVFGTIVLAVLIAAAADSLNFQLLKPFFGRFRPCWHDPQSVRILLGCAGRLGFPSNHASNAAALVTFLILAKVTPKANAWLAMFALAVGWSRIYIGVHYPLDIIAGFIVGSSLAYICFIILKPILFYSSPVNENKILGR